MRIPFSYVATSVLMPSGDVVSAIECYYATNSKHAVSTVAVVREIGSTEVMTIELQDFDPARFESASLAEAAPRAAELTRLSAAESAAVSARRVHRRDA